MKTIAQATISGFVESILGGQISVAGINITIAEQNSIEFGDFVSIRMKMNQTRAWFGDVEHHYGKISVENKNNESSLIEGKKPSLTDSSLTEVKILHIEPQKVDVPAKPIEEVESAQIQINSEAIQQAPKSSRASRFAGTSVSSVKQEITTNKNPAPQSRPPFVQNQSFSDDDIAF